MKRNALILSLWIAMGLALWTAEAKAQTGPGYGWGPGHGGGYGMGPGMMGDWISVPEKLPAPKNQEWIDNLREVLDLEKKSYRQYSLDAEKYNAAMPYLMVIPQEEDHVFLIERLFTAYGAKPGRKSSPVVETKSLREAFELCEKMERDLILRYIWLVQKAEDRDSAMVLNHILIQTRWHLAMFEHALGLGGYGMGPGMMGRGYGYTYGPQYRQPQLVLDEKNAREILENYLMSTRNPNLKLGKIEDKGNAFEAEILTKNGSLADKLLVDKNTGWIRSIY